MDKEEEIKDTSNSTSIENKDSELNDTTASLNLDSTSADSSNINSNSNSQEDKRKSTLSEDSNCDSKDSDSENNNSINNKITSPSSGEKKKTKDKEPTDKDKKKEAKKLEKQRLEQEKIKAKEEKERAEKEEKERVEQEKMRLKEEKERAKREEKEEKIKSKEDKKQPPAPSTITREPSVISKIFSSKKSNSNNSLNIERSSSPTPPTSISLENSRKSFNDSTTGNLINSGNSTPTSSPSTDNLSSALNAAGAVDSVVDQTTEPCITTPSTTESADQDTTLPSTNEDNSSITTTPQQPVAAINNKEELSTSTTTNGKKEVVIKVTRAFNAVVHVNILKEEGENKMRNKVINEIINTEKDYIADLQVIINNILLPLKEIKLITDKDISTIFSNIQLLLNVNKELLNDLEKAANETQGASVGPCFKFFSEFLKIYSSYCANQKISSDHIALCSKKIPAFKQFLDEKQSLPECRQCNLDSLLIKPVQRLCKYPLLLRELIKNSIENHPDSISLEEAYNKIQTVVLSVNESKRKAEVLQKMYKIHEKLETSFEFDFLTPTRYLIREDTLRELTEEKDKVSGKMHYYLFNDIIMRTKKDKKSIKLETLFVIASTHVNGDENRNSTFCNTFEVSQVGSTGRKFTLVADTYEQKMEWLADLESLIRPHQEQSMREYEKLLDESPFQFKRTTIATSNPSNQPDSPKSLSRSVTASTLQSKTIPSKPLPPPPPKHQNSPSAAKPSINQQPLSSPSTPTPNFNSNNTTPSSTPPPSTTNLTSKLASASIDSLPNSSIVKPKPVGVTRKMTAPSIPSSSSNSGVSQESNTSSHSTFSSNRTVPTSVTPSSSSQTSTPEISSPTPVPKSTTNSRPLPVPGSFNQESNTTTTTKPPQTTNNNNNNNNNVTVPSKPSIAFPSKLSQLKSAAPQSNSTRSHSTFVPSSSRVVEPITSQPQSKDDSNIHTTIPTSGGPPAVKPRVMPLPPKNAPASSSGEMTPPKPLPIPSKKPIIPPRNN